MRQIRVIDFNKIYDFVQKWLFIPLVAGISLVLLVWSIDSIRTWLQAHGLKGLDVPAIAGITLAALMFVILSFQHDLKIINDKMSLFSPSASSKIIRGGIREVYPELQRILLELGTGTSPERTLDVLGLTLFTAWPMLLEPNLGAADGGLRGWLVNAFFVCPEFAKSNPSFSPTWALQADAQRVAIEGFLSNNAENLRKFGTTFNVKQYKFVPAVHGFRTGAGHLLISYSHWIGEVLDGPNQFYECFQPSDKSMRANYYRALFGNWFERANK